MKKYKNRHTHRFSPIIYLSKFKKFHILLTQFSISILKYIYIYKFILKTKNVKREYHRLYIKKTIILIKWCYII